MSNHGKSVILQEHLLSFIIKKRLLLPIHQYAHQAYLHVVKIVACRPVHFYVATPGPNGSYNCLTRAPYAHPGVNDIGTVFENF